MVTEEWRCLRRRELTEAAERDRVGAINRFYTGRELQRLLHPRAPATYLPLLYTDIQDTVLVASNSSELAAFRVGLASYMVQTERTGSVCISGITLADLGKVLCRYRAQQTGSVRGSLTWSREQRPLGPTAPAADAGISVQ